LRVFALYLGMDYQVISKDRFTSEVTLTPPFPPKIVRGSAKLLQIIVLSLLNSPGRNVQYPDMGSGLPALIGQYNLTESSHNEVFAEITLAVDKVKKEIIANQKTLTLEDPSALLADLVALKIELGETIDNVKVRFRMITQNGKIEEFNL